MNIPADLLAQLPPELQKAIKEMGKTEGAVKVDLANQGHIADIIDSHIEKALADAQRAIDALLPDADHAQVLVNTAMSLIAYGLGAVGVLADRGSHGKPEIADKILGNFSNSISRTTPFEVIIRRKL